MAFAEKKLLTFDAGTLALWRVAESGDIEELVALLPRVVDINARNEHGMTALMRAAQHGRVKMVRVLLEHGADANIKRNDKFTALALAAFFGHTEVVRVLMEHGADSRASTRGGTSPQMWATARTFNEVANQLDNSVAPGTQIPRKPLQVVKPSSIVDKPSPIIEKPAASPIIPPPVRTLKDPPEIWDLVHEEPRGFDARAVFVTRVKSIRTGFAFRVATAVVVIGVCVVSVLVLRRVQARNERNAQRQPSNAVQPYVNVQAAPVVPLAAPVSLPPTASETALPPQPASPTNDNNKPITVAKFGSHARAVNPRHIPRTDTQLSTSDVAQPLATSVEKPATQTPVPAKTKVSTNVPLSPQLITPAKTAAPKGKVIQWP